jgi:dihydroorotate dehydrogenase (fumarate)
MPDLSTSYLGLTLKNPLVASASPQCEVMGNVELMEEVGASAVVLHSLFEEQLVRESLALDEGLSAGTESYAESLSYLPDMARYNLGPEGYLEHIRRVKKAVSIPVIASLNGSTKGGWIDFAGKIEQAGADALELNIYYVPVDPQLTGSDVEQLYVDIVKEVKATVKIPVAVKFGPYFSAVANFAKRLDEAGADGLVLFNRFYQPDFDLEQLEVVPNLILSNPYELLLRLHWVAVLYGNIRPDLAITGGAHSANDVLKSMMAGARVTMMTSALLRHGIHHLLRVHRELVQWMEEHEYESIRQMQGSMSRKSVPQAQTAAFERGNYMKVLSSYVAGMPV